MGICLGLLDRWLSGQDDAAPGGLGAQTRLPAGHWTGERAATDVLALARKGRAFRSLDRLQARQGGPQLLAGCVLALAAAAGSWSQLTGTRAADLVSDIIR